MKKSKRWVIKEHIVKNDKKNNKKNNWLGVTSIQWINKKHKLNFAFKSL